MTISETFVNAGQTLEPGLKPAQFNKRLEWFFSAAVGYNESPVSGPQSEVRKAARSEFIAATITQYLSGGIASATPDMPPACVTMWGKILSDVAEASPRHAAKLATEAAIGGWRNAFLRTEASERAIDGIDRAIRAGNGDGKLVFMEFAGLPDQLVQRAQSAADRAGRANAKEQLLTLMHDRFGDNPDYRQSQVLASELCAMGKALDVGMFGAKARAGRAIRKLLPARNTASKGPDEC